MGFFTVSKKTGFSCLESPVEIFDSNGALFYYRKPERGQISTFNLPTGQYFTDNKIERLKASIAYTGKKLPKPQKKVNNVELKIHLVNNPSKASIDVNTGNVFIDPKFKNVGKPLKDYLCLHEVGHFMYYDERLCDWFAENEMLKMGYNPSQISAACEALRNDENLKAQCEKHMKKVRS